MATGSPPTFPAALLAVGRTTPLSVKHRKSQRRPTQRSPARISSWPRRLSSEIVPVLMVLYRSRVRGWDLSRWWVSLYAIEWNASYRFEDDAFIVTDGSGVRRHPWLSEC